MTCDADALILEVLRSQQRRRHAERSNNQEVLPAIKMIIGDWYVDELGMPTREITARDQRRAVSIRKAGSIGTIVRPIILTDGRRTGAHRVQLDARDWRSGLISRSDLADFLVRQINDASLVHKTPAVIA